MSGIFLSLPMCSTDVNNLLYSCTGNWFAWWLAMHTCCVLLYRKLQTVYLAQTLAVICILPALVVVDLKTVYFTYELKL